MPTAGRLLQGSWAYIQVEAKTLEATELQVKDYLRLLEQVVGAPACWTSMPRWCLGPPGTTLGSWAAWQLAAQEARRADAGGRSRVGDSECGW